MVERIKEINESFKKVHMLHRFNLHKSISATGIYMGQPPILNFIYKNNNCTQKELADYLMVSPASVAVSIRRMQKSGLIEKVADKKDMRLNRIYLTNKGREISEFCKKEFEKTELLMLSGFSDDELNTISLFLKRISDNLLKGIDNPEEFKAFSDNKDNRKSESQEANND